MFLADWFVYPSLNCAYCDVKQDNRKFEFAVVKIKPKLHNC